MPSLAEMWKGRVRRMKTINIQSPVGVVLLQSFVSPGVYRLDEHTIPAGIN